MIQDRVIEIGGHPADRRPSRRFFPFFRRFSASVATAASAPDDPNEPGTPELGSWGSKSVVLLTGGPRVRIHFPPGVSLVRT